MASMVTTAPLRSNSSSSSGMAVISLDLASVATWANVRRFATAQALTTCTAERPTVRRAELRLAVDRDRGQIGGARDDRRQPRTGHQRRDPGGEALLEGQRIDEAEDAAEGIVRGDTAGQGEEGLEPIDLRVGIVSDLHPIVGAAEDGASGDEEDLVEAVDAALFAAGVGQVREMINDRDGAGGRGRGGRVGVDSHGVDVPEALGLSSRSMVRKPPDRRPAGL